MIIKSLTFSKQVVQYIVHKNRGVFMNAIAYSNLRANLSSTMERVCEDHSPIIVTKKNNHNVVMISLEDYEALDETAYLLSNPKNAERLLRSIKSMESGAGKTLKKEDLLDA